MSGFASKGKREVRLDDVDDVDDGEDDGFGVYLGEQFTKRVTFRGLPNKSISGDDKPLQA